MLVWFVALMVIEVSAESPTPYQLIISLLLMLFLSVTKIYREE